MRHSEDNPRRPEEVWVTSKVVQLEEGSIEELRDRNALSLISPMPVPWAELMHRLARAIVESMMGGHDVTMFSGSELDAA